ncbi:transposase family protein [Nonomuraea salmonea]|uniref:transposase family protein n=1 Tax=Nonomuraea salmonea TaxID=46181 RepID=UPI003CD06357
MSGQPQARAGDAGAARCRRRVNTGSGTLSVIGLAEWITVRTFRPVAVLLITSICRVLVKELVAVLFPHLVGVCGEQVVRSGATVRIRARTGTVEAACPSCGTRSQQVHSRYERRLSDTAVGGQEVLIHLGGASLLLPCCHVCEGDLCRAGAGVDRPLRPPLASVARRRARTGRRAYGDVASA